MTFSLKWSPDHLKVMGKIEQAVLQGGLFALAMPRGCGKTSLCEAACLWAILTGAREFVCLIGSDEGHAADMLDAIKTELECNDLLLEDFPEAVYPVRCLEGIANRCAGQTYRGERTHIEWTAREIVLPTVPGSRASGAIIKVAGITGRIRGMKYKRPDGKTVRPSLVVLDDPQTDESARSRSRSARPGRASWPAPCSAWRGRAARSAASCPAPSSARATWPTASSTARRTPSGTASARRWSTPSRRRRTSGRGMPRSGRRACATTAGAGRRRSSTGQHREAMDAGAVVAWPERHNEDELSAVQHAMNLKLQDEAAFWAEYQNEPLPEDEGDADMLSADDVAAKTNGLPRGTVPVGCDHVTMFIDVQQKLLFFLVAAWQSDFTGYVIDYGTYPDQKRPYFTLSDAQRTLARAAPGAGLEGSIYAGLEKLTAQYLAREWRRDDGAMLRIDRCLIDANWGQSTDVVYQFCRQSESRGRAAAEPRALRRRGERALHRVQAQARRPRRPPLEDPERAGTPGGAPRRAGHQLLEVLRARAAEGVHGRRGLPLALRPAPRPAPDAVRAPDVRVPRAHAGPRPDGGRVEGPRRQAGQPLAGLPGRLRGGGVGAGRGALRHGLGAAAGAATHQAIRTPEGEALSGAGIVIEAGGRDGRADVLPLRLPALPGDLHAAHPWRQDHAAAGVPELRAA